MNLYLQAADKHTYIHISIYTYIGGSFGEAGINFFCYLLLAF